MKLFINPLVKVSKSCTYYFRDHNESSRLNNKEIVKNQFKLNKIY